MNNDQFDKNLMNPMYPPAIDERTLSTLIAQMKRIAPYYTPEWRFTPDDPDPGTALFYLAAEMVEENIKRLNRAPLNHFIAFLNLLQVKLQEARPAKSRILFRLTEGMRDSVWIPAGTAVTAEDPDNGDELVYETVTPLLVSPASLMEIYNVDPLQDQIVQLTEKYSDTRKAGEEQLIQLFQTDIGENLQQHTLYLRHDDLFLFTHPAEIQVEWINTLQRYKEEELAAAFANPELLEWAYASRGDWVAFERVEAIGNIVFLRKEETREVDVIDIGGISGRYIRCRLREGEAASSFLGKELDIDSLRVGTSFLPMPLTDGIPAERLFYNDIELAEAGFYPFGEHFAPYATFYMASEEVFGKKQGEAELELTVQAELHPLRTGPEPEINWKMIMKRSELDKKDPPKVLILKVLWEYWNGGGWIRIPGTAAYEEMFTSLSADEPLIRSLSFQIPADLDQTYVNSQFGYWIRVRVMNMSPLYSHESIYVTPRIDNLSLRYTNKESFAPLQSVFTLNNMELKDRTLSALRGGELIRPFERLHSTAPAVYLAFDVPPLKGPVRMHFMISALKVIAEERPWVEWEYWGKDGTVEGWKELKNYDETQGFTDSGAIQFAGPPDMSEGIFFGVRRYWLRAVNRDYRFGHGKVRFPVVKGIDLNSVDVLQHQSIRAEMPEKTKGRYKLSRAPVIGEEVWIDETASLSSQELDDLLEKSPDDCDVVYDNEGLVLRAWIRWYKTRDLLMSGPGDRHYILNSSQGTLHFGDGIRGKGLLSESPDHIRVNYKVTSGASGNVEKGTILQLQQSIAFIEGIINPEPASGGSSTEPLESALLRGPQLFKHRDRAVTAEDYEWLAREAYPDLARVKCLTNTNVYLEHETGAVTLVALPRSLNAYMLPSSVKRHLADYLTKRAANTVIEAPGIQVIEPAFLEISVVAVVTVLRMEELLETEQACVEKLHAFLNPFTGQSDGKGWEIGETVHLSVFFSLLKSINRVQFVEKLYMTVVKVEDGIRTEINPDAQQGLPHGLVISGSHKIDVRVT